MKRNHLAIKKKGAAFRFNIVLESDSNAQRLVEKKKSLVTDDMLKKYLENMRMKFWHQSKRAFLKLTRKDYHSIIASRYGAPGPNEKICDYSGFVVSAANEAEIQRYKRYWESVYFKSKEIYYWLMDIDHSNYSFRLHLFLSQLIVVPLYVQREIKEWQKLDKRKI